MLFWIIAAIMASAVTAALMFPMYRSRAAGESLSEIPQSGVSGVSGTGSHEMEVYRDQLAEVGRDHAAGLIGSDEAEVARAEIGRRLLAASKLEADEQAGQEGKAGPVSGHMPLGFPGYALTAFLVTMPVLAIAGYTYLGSPGTAQQPLSARLSADPMHADIGVLVANAERHLAKNPDDGRGWDVLAPIYLRSGRLADAEHAFRKAIRLRGPSASRQSGLGETLVSKAGGIVTDEARLVFQSARELDPTDPRPRYFLALALAQEGKIAEARNAFVALIANSPPEAPWIPAIRQQIASLDNAAENGLFNPAMAGQQAVAASAKQTNNRIVSGPLEERLRKNPDDIAGWLELVRTKASLGDLPGAQVALNMASATFPAGAEAAALSALAGELGLKASSGLGGVSLADQVPGGPSLSSGQMGGAGDVVAAPFIMPGKADAPANPSAADIAAAQTMSATDRQAMIRSMVESLDAKLTDNPRNIAGWLRLVRSYSVLDEKAAALSALKRGTTAFGENSEQARALAGLARELGLETGEPLK